MHNTGRPEEEKEADKEATSEVHSSEEKKAATSSQKEEKEKAPQLSPRGRSSSAASPYRRGHVRKDSAANLPRPKAAVRAIDTSSTSSSPLSTSTGSPLSTSTGSGRRGSVRIQSGVVWGGTSVVSPAGSAPRSSDEVSSTSPTGKSEEQKGKAAQPQPKSSELPGSYTRSKVLTTKKEAEPRRKKLLVEAQELCAEIEKGEAGRGSAKELAIRLANLSAAMFKEMTLEDLQDIGMDKLSTIDKTTEMSFYNQYRRNLLIAINVTELIKNAKTDVDELKDNAKEVSPLFSKSFKNFIERCEKWVEIQTTIADTLKPKKSAFEEVHFWLKVIDELHKQQDTLTADFLFNEILGKIFFSSTDQKDLEEYKSHYYRDKKKLLRYKDGSDFSKIEQPQSLLELCSELEGMPPQFILSAIYSFRKNEGVVNFNYSNLMFLTIKSNYYNDTINDLTDQLEKKIENKIDLYIKLEALYEEAIENESQRIKFCDKLIENASYGELEKLFEYKNGILQKQINLLRNYTLMLTELKNSGLIEESKPPKLSKADIANINKEYSNKLGDRTELQRQFIDQQRTIQSFIKRYESYYKAEQNSGIAKEKQSVDPYPNLVEAVVKYREECKKNPDQNSSIIIALNLLLKTMEENREKTMIFKLTIPGNLQIEINTLKKELQDHLRQLDNDKTTDIENIHNRAGKLIKLVNEDPMFTRVGGNSLTKQDRDMCLQELRSIFDASTPALANPMQLKSKIDKMRDEYRAFLKENPDNKDGIAKIANDVTKLIHIVNTNQDFVGAVSAETRADYQRQLENFQLELAPALANSDSFKIEIDNLTQSYKDILDRRKHGLTSTYEQKSVDDIVNLQKRVADLIHIVKENSQFKQKASESDQQMYLLQLLSLQQCLIVENTFDAHLDKIRNEYQKAVAQRQDEKIKNLQTRVTELIDMVKNNKQFLELNRIREPEQYFTRLDNLQKAFTIDKLSYEISDLQSEYDKLPEEMKKAGDNLTAIKDIANQRERIRERVAELIQIVTTNYEFKKMYSPEDLKVFENKLQKLRIDTLPEVDKNKARKEVGVSPASQEKKDSVSTEYTDQLYTRPFTRGE